MESIEEWIESEALRGLEARVIGPAQWPDGYAGNEDWARQASLSLVAAAVLCADPFMQDFGEPEHKTTLILSALRAIMSLN